MAHTAVKKWAGHFRSWRESVADDARAGQPANIEKVKWEIKKNRRKMIGEVADSTDISCTVVHKIVRQNLETKRVCSKLV